MLTENQRSQCFVLNIEYDEQNALQHKLNRYNQICVEIRNNYQNHSQNNNNTEFEYILQFIEQHGFKEDYSLDQLQTMLNNHKNSKKMLGFVLDPHIEYFIN